MKPHLTFCCIAVSAGICHSNMLRAQTPDFGKSYINVTKGISGGTVETGDTLEIRASFVVRAGTFDSCAYYDAIPAGTAYIAGTVRVLTNEGKIYKQFTDAVPDDEGWITGSNMQINLGYRQTASPATRYRRGRVANTHRPSFYNSSCIMIASYRVKVIAATGSLIGTGGGAMTYRNGSAALQTYTFPANSVAVYSNYGICANTVGVNSLGTEFNGTFGSGKPRNRGTSGNVPAGYTYSTFSTNSPQDYFYGVANNTSTQNYSTTDSWPKPDNSTPSHRVFNVWDIIGDHSGAASLSAGNPAADTVVSGSGGYMLVINAAYRIDSAFQHTISGLCPNTYYEIACWMRNICSKCGCDSAGRGAGTVGYLPTATGDSSGVSPNLTFEVDGVDYYTTGNLLYSGLWVKKGFTFKTGPSQTSFTLKFFNNAPGGGGNDWALDDITVATCSPDLLFTPTNNPTICKGNVVNIGCIVKSYFNNYTSYKWQKSTDIGVNWIDASTPGSGSPTWNGSEWVYSIGYPPFVAAMADSGTKFKVVVATTAPNLSNSSCAFSETVSVITLNIIDCGSPLYTQTSHLSGERKNNKDYISWTAPKSEYGKQYGIETSTDGRNFTLISPPLLLADTSVIHQRYTAVIACTGNVSFYRVRIGGANGSLTYSGIIKLSNKQTAFFIQTLDNPIYDRLEIQIGGMENEDVCLQLFDGSGKKLWTLSRGMQGTSSGMLLPNTSALANSVYTLQATCGSYTVTKKLIKLSR